MFGYLIFTLCGCIIVTYTIAVRPQTNTLEKHLITSLTSIKFKSNNSPFRRRSRLGQFLLAAPSHVRLAERRSHATTAAQRHITASRHHAGGRCGAARKRAALRNARRRLRRAQMRR